MPVTVKAITDGPLMLKGECEVQDGQGNAIPGKGGDIPIRVNDATEGAAAKLTVPRWFSRPWSRPRAIF